MPMQNLHWYSISDLADLKFAQSVSCETFCHKFPQFAAISKIIYSRVQSLKKKNVIRDLRTMLPASLSFLMAPRLLVYFSGTFTGPFPSWYRLAIAEATQPLVQIMGTEAAVAGDWEPLGMTSGLPCRRYPVGHLVRAATLPLLGVHRKRLHKHHGMV